MTESSEEVFHWDDSNIGMLANYGNIAYITCVMPVCWFMDVKGSVLVCYDIRFTPRLVLRRKMRGGSRNCKLS